ncbi:CPBP family intramembrane glutamic endopeptidase [Listeria ivanovii]|uniref:CPBP family intramembrane metalloprotease n=2 Tax=Listeria ivanovii TaxID=1638 RepID=A0ABS1G1H0_LISIV|nr:CPBP family intramembrane glutamic endopeptidase [Listeria ivanovii]AIS59422.1 CAAX protease [Listeria ivanovii subsp. londoniensis]AIS62253.1 CAAX protease [Listeria ivanovii subsp. londoniensis]MBK1960711.1 CPBP family intramembrane metalloprotease [Listeria ivanovii subsp. londoniensis]MBK1965366.1 CPBP family intramembrane metalloprotease [Listeria ivanovii subsp. londoniensis]MBK1983193.1 CPBP family intramembrane metalloprotease [Listeria ivanovii subsp. londoniensis]
MKSIKIDYKLVLGLILCALLVILTYQFPRVFWYLYGAGMLFLLSFVIFNDDLKKEYSFTKGILPGVFSGIVLYIVFYIGAFILKIMPGGLENSVAAAFNKYATDSWVIWLLLVVAIIPGEEIFWRGFVLKRLNNYFNPWFSNIFAALLCMVMMFPSGNFAAIIGIFVASLVWNVMYTYRSSLLMVYVSHLTFAFLLLAALPIY